MAERDSRLGRTTCSGDGSSAGKPLCSLATILCTSSKDLVERAFDEA